MKRIVPKDDLSGILADLKRQRDDIDARIKELEDGDSTANILDRLKKWRERAEQTATKKIGPDDTTVNTRR